MAAPLQQPRVEGAGTRGRDEGHAALVSSRKRPRVVAETHDDSVAFARAASLRASDYGAWLSECKTRWRSLRNKLALVRNFVKLEANGDSLELGGILDPTGARAREKKRGFSRWKTVRAEEVRVGDIPHLTGDFKRLLAMLEAHPVTGGRAPPGDGKETGGKARPPPRTPRTPPRTPPPARLDSRSRANASRTRSTTSPRALPTTPTRTISTRTISTRTTATRTPMTVSGDAEPKAGPNVPPAPTSKRRVVSPRASHPPSPSGAPRMRSPRTATTRSRLRHRRSRHRRARSRRFRTRRWRGSRARRSRRSCRRPRRSRN